MKVLHITYSSKGGAGIAALRLHNALQENGVESAYVSGNLTVDFENKEIDDPFFKYKKPSLLKRVYNKIITALIVTKTQKIKKEINVIRKGVKTFEIISSPFSSFKIENHPLYKEADIINLHWVSGIIDYSTFFKSCKKQIVWTLHDMNPFMGCFHYKLDEEKNKERFNLLEENIKQIKKESYQKSLINTIVSPSQWLLKESQISNLLENYSHKKIYNCADEFIFKPLDSILVRNELQLPQDKIIVSFVCQNLVNYRKGFDIIEGLIDLFSDKNVLFLAVGKIPEKKNKKIHYVGSISDTKHLVKIYGASDVFLLPSREDNLPNTMVESLLCGIPVISHSVGGMKEIIENGKNGYLISDFKIKSFESCILKFIENKELLNKNMIATDAKAKFSKNIASKNYFNLYKSICNE